MELFRNKEWKNREVQMMGPLQLAYVGDAVYEMYIRNYLIENKNAKVNQLHRLATHYVKAKAQSDILWRIESELTDEEKTIVRRGRNAKSYSVPKNAKLSDYRNATALEALIGFLFLEKRDDRLKEVLDMTVVD
ncbi:MAG: Mini-ribonuclease 3 [Tissierellales bacterium]|nr:Mini-ribonuclease 3 [Tissierellales bacterium]